MKVVDMSSVVGNVTVIDHPLIQHKLTIMRNKETSIAGFRRLLREIAHLMCYEVTRDLELEMIPIETPMTAMDSPAIKGKKLVFASILRAGNGLMACSTWCPPRVLPISASIATTRRLSRSNTTSRRHPISKIA
jgi:uracil phosphoribosyltransferase